MANKKKIRKAPSGPRRVVLGGGAIVQRSHRTTLETNQTLARAGAGEPVLAVGGLVFIDPPEVGNVLELEAKVELVTATGWSDAQAARLITFALELSLDGGDTWSPYSGNGASLFPANLNAGGDPTANRMRWAMSRYADPIVVFPEFREAALEGGGVLARAFLQMSSSEDTNVVILGGNSGYLQLQECLPYPAPL